ncbi:MAG TPA: peptide chain release factor N(5)-glutamine methyltransferase [Methylocella sp.]|nr:peptide chain release factor N(5)-glutamine methyltransferase [Methylocella sp.]
MLEFDDVQPREPAFKRLASAFRDAGIESATLDARLLLCAALKIDHASLLRNPLLPLGAGAAVLSALAARRLAGEPVSRILGFREFWDARFKITPAVLDPRPESETLIEAALEHATDRSANWRILDLGTGSGMLLASLLLGLPHAFGVGVDISPAACQLAKANLATFGLLSRSHVICGDWGASLKGEFDLILTNPPYVATGSIAQLAPEVRDYDPHLALDGGEDGLAAYRALIPGLNERLAPGGLIAIELGEGQYASVQKLLAGHFAESARAKLDLDGKRRVMVLRKAPPAIQLAAIT